MVSDMKYVGFYQETELPIKKGMTITIPKGTILKSMHPSRCNEQGIPVEYESKKTQKVKIDHVLNGMSYHASFMREKDATLYGISVKDLEEKRKAYYDAIRERGFDNVGPKEHSFPISNPKVVWAGAGGYWVEVDINEVEYEEA